MNFNTPEFTPAPTKERWLKQRNRIQQQLILIMGDLPPVTIPDVQILSREHKEGYVVENFEFHNNVGALVSGYFLTPDNGKEKHPAVYYCHWHGGNYDLGAREIFTTHHTPETPAETFTRNGYAVMAIDAYCFGERSGKGPGGPEEKGAAEELSASKFQLWMGRSLWSMMLRDDLMALAYLFSRPDIDVNRVGATGISMGATRSWWLMALEERLKTAVAVGCMTRYQDLIAEQKLKNHGIYYYVPGILEYFDTEAIISLIAPRPILFMTGDNDPGSPVNGIRKIEKSVKEVYGIYSADNEFQSIVYPDTTHVYTPDMWSRMQTWLHEKLHP